MTPTDRDVRSAVAEIVDACHGTYSVDGIVADLVHRYHLTGPAPHDTVDTVDADDFWHTVLAHAI